MELFYFSSRSNSYLAVHQEEVNGKCAFGHGLAGHVADSQQNYVAGLRVGLGLARLAAPHYKQLPSKFGDLCLVHG